jgi:hypothetical protein
MSCTNLRDAVRLAKEIQQWMLKTYHTVIIDRNKITLFKSEKDGNPTVIYCPTNDNVQQILQDRKRKCNGDDGGKKEAKKARIEKVRQLTREGSKLISLPC